MTGSSEAPPAPKVAALLEAVIYAADLDAAEAFYGWALGLAPVGKVPGRHVFFRAGSGVLLIFNPAATEIHGGRPELPVPPHGARGPGHVCLAADAAQLAEWKARLEAMGVAIEADFHWPNGARSIYFRDPAGNSVELAEPRLWAPG